MSLCVLSLWICKVWAAKICISFWGVASLLKKALKKVYLKMKIVINNNNSKKKRCVLIFIQLMSMESNQCCYFGQKQLKHSPKYVLLCVFCRRKKAIQVWNEMSVCKWWQNFHSIFNNLSDCGRYISLSLFYGLTGLKSEIWLTHLIIHTASTNKTTKHSNHNEVQQLLVHIMTNGLTNKQANELSFLIWLKLLWKWHKVQP